jgi:class 3 adenylate cyclase
VGVELPLENLQQAGLEAMGKAANMLDGRDAESLFDNPDSNNKEMLLAQRSIRNLMIAAFMYNQELFPLLVGQSVSISLEYGNAPESALSFANYGLMLGAFRGMYKEGLKFGELALRLCDRFHGVAPTATVCLVLGSELMPWVQPVRFAIPIIKRGYEEGLASGDILWAGYLVMYRVLLDAFGGKRLDELLDGMSDQLDFTSRTQNPGATAGILAHQIVLSTLAGRTKSSSDFSGGGVDEVTFLLSCEERHIAMAICFYKILKAQALYLFGRPQQAYDATREIDDKLSYIVNHPILADRLLYQSLALASLWGGKHSDERRAAMEQLQVNLAQLKKWSDSCPDNFLAKRLMVQAEIARITGDEAAADLYDNAIDAAHERQFVQDEALANELAGRFVIERRPTSRVATMYLRDARYAYSIWGASRKIEELELEFPQLLTEYREVHVRTAGSLVGIGTIESGSSTLGTGLLDLNTLVKASQTISSEVVLGRLLERLLSILIENAGAQRGLLLLSRAGELYVEAEASVVSDEAAVLMSIPIDTSEGASLIPIAVAHYTARTKEVVVVDDAQQDPRFMADPYVQKRETRSVLCQPILHQGQMIGLVYLENDLVTAAFTPERTRLLELLSGQIAVSIKNAELVEHLEEKVRERTTQLELRTQFIEQTFGRYMSSEIADSLLKSPEGLDFGGQKRTVTILLSDLRGFSSFSETLPPETIVKMLNNYFSEMTTVVQKYNGTIDEFIGDAILVIFGAPLQRRDDAERAVACAVEMQMNMSRVNSWNAQHGFPALEMGIGINTGEVVAGNIGSRKRAKYSVIGNNVNLAGRIESYTIGGQVLISKSTRDAVKTPLKILRTITAEPKGVSRPVTIYEVGGLGGDHGLVLPRHEVRWSNIKPALPVTFQLVAGKEVMGTKHGGVLVRLAATEGEIQCRTPPPPFADLKLTLKPTDSISTAVGIYGKVSGPPSKTGRFVLRFTAVPKDARQYLDSLGRPQSKQK